LSAFFAIATYQHNRLKHEFPIQLMWML